MAKRGRKVHLGDAAFSVPGGQKTTLRVTLTKRGRKLLRKRGKLAATATLTAKPAIVGAADKVKKAPLKIRVAKKKKQKR